MNADTSCNWTVSVQYVSCNVWWVHQIARISTCNRPRNTDRVFHLKKHKYRVKQVTFPSIVHTNLYVFFCEPLNVNFLCTPCGIHQRHNGALSFASIQNLLNFLRPHCYCCCYCCCGGRKTLLLGCFALQLFKNKKMQWLMLYCKNVVDL